MINDAQLRGLEVEQALRFIVHLPMGKKIKKRLVVAAFIIIAISCNRKMASQLQQAEHKPDYSLLQLWAAHPYKYDPSDSTPMPLKPHEIDSTVDVFFLHPTTFTKKSARYKCNASLDDKELNEKTDKSSILYQASIFNNYRVFAPRYRQAHYHNYFSTDTVASKKAFELAYQDVKNAFETYLEKWNGQRPIVIAGHSQGSMLAIRLLQDYFENKPLSNRLVVAYVAGWPVYEGTFKTLPMCRDSLMTGCACSWRTFEDDYVPAYITRIKKQALVTNPLSWTMDSTPVPSTANKGSIFKNFNHLYMHSTGARTGKGVLWIQKPKFPYSFLYVSKNYHIGDLNIFYLNVREDVRRRVGLFWKR